MTVCERCTENNNCAWQNHEDTICHDAPAFPMTNADRIRGMTDEEMAKVIRDHKCNNCDWWTGSCEHEENCKDEVLEWLKQEIKTN